LRTVFNQSAEALNSLAGVIKQLPSPGMYSASCAALSNGSIGEHTRHIIELYQCLLGGYESGIVNYDDRKRNKLYENDPDAALDAISTISVQLDRADKAMKICLAYEAEMLQIDSNYYREVLYNLEHCIHHQALIKVALLAFEDIQIGDSFGVAPSTLQYRRQCAQ
jgi:hypothetical protein